MSRRRFQRGILLGVIAGWVLIEYFFRQRRCQLSEGECPPGGVSEGVARTGGGGEESKTVQEIEIPNYPEAGGAPVVSGPERAAEGGTAAADDLTKIEGIGPKIAGLLNQNGLHTFAQLAAIDAERLRQILTASGMRLALIDPTSWPEQACLAAAGDWEGLQRLQKDLVGGRHQ